MKDDAVYLKHVANSLVRIRTYTAAGKETFYADSMIQDAVIRNLEIVGEAVKRLSNATCDKAPHIPWKQIAGMRDVLIHNYFGVQLDRVWQVVERDVPVLEKAVSDLLPSTDK